MSLTSTRLPLTSTQLPLTSTRLPLTYIQVLGRLKALPPGEQLAEDPQAPRFHLWRNYVFFLCAGNPAPDAPRADPAAARELFRTLVPLLRSPAVPEAAQVRR